jgi:rod shape-determining protein MreC
MLKNVKRYTYILIAVFIWCQLSLSTAATDRLRSISVATLAPSWNLLSDVKGGFSQIAAVWPSGGYRTSPHVQREFESMRLEIHNLRSQLELMKAQVDLEKLVVEEAELLKHFARDDAFSKRRKSEIFRLIDLYSPSVIGKVIFRETTAWSSSLWINLGEKTNQVLGKIVIAKNSPVVMGTTVLGIVEYVGYHRSRVRLITDSSIAPSVRVLRGSQQSQVIAQQSKKLLFLLETYEDHPIKKELIQFIQKLCSSGEDFYLAKGELRGIRGPLFRSRQALLQGVGFNYDFEDEEGLSRDLRTGKTSHGTEQKIALVQKGDILVTTGMDGIFPPGLKVGQVTLVYPLQEGASAYELDAVPLIENFNNIPFVTVLPPLDTGLPE